MHRTTTPTLAEDDPGRGSSPNRRKDDYDPFYRERARIIRRLIEEKGFDAVAVEADWPDAYRVNRALEALGGFERFLLPATSCRGKNRHGPGGWLARRRELFDQALEVGSRQ